jgi:glucose-6-phosphate isomerase
MNTTVVPSPDLAWTRFQQLHREFPECGLSLDLSRLAAKTQDFTRMQVPMSRALEAMTALEAGAIANPDENRRVGHYWLRDPDRAPEASWGQAIRQTQQQVKEFADAVHQGRISGAGGAFIHLLVIGIGGSALGPQFVANALGQPVTDKLDVRFFDNTDPDGMDRTLAPIVHELGQTLVLVISKSGGTPETRNGMLEAAAAYQRAGLSFARHAVAVTQLDDASSLFRLAKAQEWLALFPMWDWVGGRTSLTSAVGLLPAALQGISIDALLEGARTMDTLTRRTEVDANPAAWMALGWYHAGAGRGAKDMVVLPYKDRLELLARYLQQLVMESLGKELDLDGRIVHQGLAVYGNKGSTDQHAYIQQLRDGLNNFFVTFVEVLRDREGTSVEVEPGVTSGDFLQGFLLGTRQALFENGRESITLRLREWNAFSLGALVALFERTVGLYASLVHINAYHQPGVEAGKKAAAGIILTKIRLVDFLRQNPGRAFSPDELAQAVTTVEPETAFHLLERLSAVPGSGITRTAGSQPAATRYQFTTPV